MLSSAALATTQQPAPLILKSQGSFFVGGETKRISEPPMGPMPAQDGDITVNQMYVQYQIPMNDRDRAPVVMVHGCCLSSKTWESTPDGRPGWSEYFVRHDLPVYLAEQVSRARSGFDPTAFYEVRSKKRRMSRMPSIDTITHQLAWMGFRFGPKFGEAFPDEQFPVEFADEFYKQMIPDLNSTLPRNQNPTWAALATLAARLDGAILMGHSESGFFPERAALVDPKDVRGIVTIESDCETDLNSKELSVLAKIPTLVIFGDHLEEVTLTLTSGTWTWSSAYASCNRFIGQLRRSGGDAQMMHLPSLGIKGNSHMLMQDRNSDQIADLVMTWIQQHVARGNQIGFPR